MKMYYAIWDNQINDIRSIGFNSQNKTQVRKELIEYLLLGNFSEEGELSIKKNTLDELLNYYEFTLLQSNSKFTDDFDIIELFTI